MPSPLHLLLLLLSCLCATVLLAPVSAHFITDCSSSQSRPRSVAYLNGSLFTAVYNYSHELPYIVARVDATTGRVQHRYILDAGYVITNLFTSATRLYSVAANLTNTGPMRRQDIVVHDIATGRLIQVLVNVTGAVQSVDRAGRVIARANYNTVDLLDARTGKVTHTIDIDKHGLMPLAVQMHPTNGHVFILNEIPFEILEVRSNSSVVATIPLSDGDYPTTFSIDSTARYAYTLRVTDNAAPYTLFQYDLSTGRVGWSATLGKYPAVKVIPSVAAGDDGEAWLGEGTSGSLLRFDKAGNSSLCLDERVKPTRVVEVAQR